MAEIRICTLCQQSLPVSAYSQRQWTKRSPKCQTCMPDTNRHCLNAFGELTTPTKLCCHECREILPRAAFGRTLRVCRSCNKENNERLRRQSVQEHGRNEEYDF